MTVVGASGHASFLVPGNSTAEQNAYIVWNGTWRANADWSAEVRGHNAAAFSVNGGSSLQLFAFMTAGGSSSFEVEFSRLYRSGVEQAEFQYWSSPPELDEATVSVPSSRSITDFRLRIIYRSVTKLFESWYDDTGLGTNWKLIRSEVVPDWTAASEFGVGLAANTYYAPVTEGQLWADDFRLVNALLDVPVISTQPVSQSVAVGNAVTLSVAATGTGFTYQWLKDGVNLSGATSSSYTVASAQSSHAGSYSVVVSNANGGVTSATATLTVNRATPVIYTAPTAASITLGQSLSASVLNGGSASAAGTFAFTAPSSVPVGTALQSLTFTPTDSTRYTTASTSVSVAVNAAVIAPSITSQPAALTVNVGSQASFSVTVTGAAPLSYQWRKGGAAIAGGTSATYTIASAQTTDAGSYSVVVSNSAGSVTSASASLTVNKITPVIYTAPTAAAITVGQSLSSSVLSGGSASAAGTFAFTAPSSVPAVGTMTQPVTFTPTDSTRYTTASASVSVNVNAVVLLPVITSATTASGTVGLVFSYQITGTNGPSSYSAAGLPVGLSVNPGTGLISGIPTSAKQSIVTLGVANSSGTGSTWLVLTILGSGTGNTGTNTVNWPALAGTYEGLLEHASEAGPNDGAVYRGSLLMTLNKNGAVSGRVFYNEATELEGAPNRLYTPVTRAFSGALSASQSDPLVFQKVVKLGSGTAAGRQELTLLVSFATSVPTVNVTVKDVASPGAGEDAWVSQSLSCVRSLTKLPPAETREGVSLDYSKAAGHYTVSATDFDPTQIQANDAYVLVQVLASGKVLWASRSKGVLGSGSTGLRVTEGGLGSVFYEGRSSSSSGLFKTTSLLGGLNFVFNSTTGGWSSVFGTEALAGKVEKQASCVFKSGGKLRYDDSEGKNWSGVTTLDFSNMDGAFLGNARVPSVPAFLLGTSVAALKFTLSAQDPLLDGDGNTVPYAWLVSVAASGKVSAVSLKDDAGTSAPKLTLTFNRASGEFGGYYSSSSTGKSLRRNMWGSALISLSDDLLRARGWVESGTVPNLDTGGWTLQLEP